MIGNSEMAPKATHDSIRSEVKSLTDIMNVGPSIANDLESLGIKSPQKLIGKDPVKLYAQLIRQTAKFHDPCVLDVFMAAIAFMNGQPPKAWWNFTAERKSLYSNRIKKLKQQFMSPSA